MSPKITKYIALVAVLLWGTLHAKAVNQVTLTNVAGEPGKDVVVSVSLTSDAPIAALQVSAALGHAAVAVNGSATAMNRAAGHSVACGTKDGVTTLMLYSTAMETIPTGDGVVAEFRLRLGEHPTAAHPTLTVKATDASGKEIDCNGSDWTVTVNGATAEFPSGPAYDFGSVAIRSHYTLSVPVANTGTTQLVISHVNFSSPDFVCDSPTPITVEAGTTGRITVGYNPMERGDISETMTVESNSSLPANVQRLLAQPFAVNEIHVGNATGASDTEVTIPITVNNMDAITGFTLEFDLPAQLTYVEGSFELSGRSAGHSVTASCINGKLRANAYSLTDAPFAENDGELASFRVKLSGRNSVTLSPSKAVLSALVNGKVTDVTSATYPGQISILYPRISTSNTLSLGRTPITQDATETLRIQNTGTAPLTIERMVVDGIEVTLDKATPFEIASWNTENVTVTLSGTEEGQVAGTLQIYSNDPDQRLFNVAVSGERYSPNSIRFTSETAETSTQRCALDLVLENYDAISGLQFDLTLPAGFEPVEVEKVGRAQGFTVNYNKVGANVVRYFIYSISEAAIAPGNDAILKLPFTYPSDTQAGRYAFTASEVKLSSAQMVDRSSMLGNVTGFVDLVTIYKAQSITISGTPEFIEAPGGEVQLTATILPENTTDKTIVWASSNPDVATVDANGKVTAVGLGETTITATAVGGDHVSTTCTILVKGKEYTLTFYINEQTYQTSKVRYGDPIVAPTIDPREGYTWSGWTDLPETMPAHDVEVHGTFTVNQYTATFFIDGEEYESLQFNYGEKVVAPDVDPREGYTWSGWTDLPETMPAHDVEVHGTFTVNQYTATFFIDGEAYQSLQFDYGEDIVAPEVEQREGYTWSGWTDLPETMPAHDVEVHGTFTVNQYTATFFIDGEEYKSLQFNYGEKVVAPDVDPREGYTWSGWTDLPETMPAHDVEVHGTFTINRYTATFFIDGEEYESLQFNYGEKVVAPDVDPREGYTWSGWTDMPETMPAHDVEVHGTFTVNQYTATFFIDGEEYQSLQFNYGEDIVAPEVEQREGYTWSGWTDLPETMPAHDVEVHGTFTINQYTATFFIDGEEYKSLQFDYGEVIVAPEVEQREGYTWSGWMNMPETMPAHDVEVHGRFNIHPYTARFFVDNEQVAELQFDYGTSIVAPEVDPREGYTWSGWTDLPETMPAHDVEVHGTFTVNQYTATFFIDGEEYESLQFDYGEDIVAPDVDPREGYTWSGWTDLPEMMPAHDVEVHGTFTVNQYTATFFIDGEEYKSLQFNYGEEIKAPEVEQREGYTWSGWTDMPETMPAHDVEVHGTFTVNSYTLTFYLNDELYLIQLVEYGDVIEVPEPIVEDGYQFDGWEEEIPETMPAHDVEIHGTTSKIADGILNIITDKESLVNVYNLRGDLLFHHVKVEDLSDQLAPGYYIIRQGRKTMKIRVK